MQSRESMPPSDFQAATHHHPMTFLVAHLCQSTKTRERRTCEGDRPGWIDVPSFSLFFLTLRPMETSLINLGGHWFPVLVHATKSASSHPRENCPISDNLSYLCNFWTCWVRIVLRLMASWLHPHAVWLLFAESCSHSACFNQSACPLFWHTGPLKRQKMFSQSWKYEYTI